MKIKRRIAVILIIPQVFYISALWEKKVVHLFHAISVNSARNEAFK